MGVIIFEWDKSKDLGKRKKHGVSFEEAATVFVDEKALLIQDPDHSDAEDRFLLLGLSSHQGFYWFVLVIVKAINEAYFRTKSPINRNRINMGKGGKHEEGI